MPPPPPQQVPFQPRSPMVVTSQPYAQPMTPVTRQTPVPPPPPPQQAAPSPRPIPQHMPQQVRTPVALPSPAPTPEQEQEESTTESGAIPTPPPPTRRQSSSLSLVPEHKMPFYPDLPWYSVPGADFPPRARRRRRRRQNLQEADAVFIPPRVTAEEDIHEQTPEEVASETSTIAAPSEPETPATSQATSESDFSPVSTPVTPAQVAVSSPKATPTQPQHARKDTRTAIAVPNIPSFQKPKPSPPAADKPEAKSPQAEEATPAPEEQKSVAAEENEAAEETPSPVSPPPKPAPKSWADLVRRNIATTSSTGLQNGGVMTNGPGLPKSASLADALKQYSTQIDARLSFLEPRGLVNTGNMCYMNSVRTPSHRPTSAH